MKSVYVLAAVILSGCAATQEQRQEWGDTKAENNASHYQSCKRQVCELSYTGTVQLFEGENPEAWRAYCTP